LNIPLIAEHTLKVMTAAFLNQLAAGPIGLLRCKGQSLSPEPLLVPMIDARRMEVYTAVYNVELNLVAPPSALILNADSFNEWKEGHHMIFFGNGSKKFEGMVSDEDFEFRDVQYDASDMAVLSYRQFLHQQFADLAYAEPFYVKEFYSTAKK
jgi:tRNA threonylcarbamoyladenosine biosynthesis protein TsaB